MQNNGNAKKHRQINCRCFFALLFIFSTKRQSVFYLIQVKASETRTFLLIVQVIGIHLLP